MAKSTKVKIAAGAAAAVTVAGGGAALAASQVWSPKTENQAVIDDAAKKLGVSSDALSAALKQAMKDRVDAAVQAGRLTKAEGDALKARIDAGGAPFVLGGLGKGGLDHLGPFAGLDAAASYLGLTETELQARLASGKTLAQIAKDEGKSVDGLVQALVKQAESKIDAAVADGRLTKAQADDLKSGLEGRVTDLVNGTFPHGRFFRNVPKFDGPMLGPWGFHAWRDGFRSHSNMERDTGPSA